MIFFIGFTYDIIYTLLGIPCIIILMFSLIIASDILVHNSQFLTTFHGQGRKNLSFKSYLQCFTFKTIV